LFEIFPKMASAGLNNLSDVVAEEHARRLAEWAIFLPENARFFRDPSPSPPMLSPPARFLSLRNSTELALQPPKRLSGKKLRRFENERALSSWSALFKSALSPLFSEPINTRYAYGKSGHVVLAALPTRSALGILGLNAPFFHEEADGGGGGGYVAEVREQQRMVSSLYCAYHYSFTRLYELYEEVLEKCGMELNDMDEIEMEKQLREIVVQKKKQNLSDTKEKDKTTPKSLLPFVELASFAVFEQCLREWMESLLAASGDERASCILMVDKEQGNEAGRVQNFLGGKPLRSLSAYYGLEYEESTKTKKVCFFVPSGRSSGRFSGKQKSLPSPLSTNPH